MKAVFRLGVFVLFLFMFGNQGYAATTVTWGGTTQATYDTSIPGTILEWYNPLSQGGMDLATGKMTNSSSAADLVFRDDGLEMGASGIVDLGAVDFNNVSDIPTSGYQKIAKSYPGHVYIVKIKDGSIVKVQVLKNLSSFVTIKYAFGESTQVLPEGTSVIYDTFVPGTDLFDSNPTGLGGLNFTDGTMTKQGTLADIAISGMDLGSRSIIDLGEVDMDTVSRIPDSGFSKMATLQPDHVYITLTHEGKFVKFYVIGNYASTVEIVYSEIKELTGITLIGPSPEEIGWDPVTLEVEGTFADGTTDIISNTDVTWTSSDDYVGTVTDDGVFQLTNEPGEVTVTASYNGFESSLTYHGPILTSLAINQTLTYSTKSVTLTATGTFEDGITKTIDPAVISWKSSNTKVATVTKGIVKFTGNSGTVIISATYMGETASVLTNVQILSSLKINQTLKYSTTPVTLTVTGQYTGQPAQTIKSGITWKSSNTKVATVDSKGVVKFTGTSGPVTISATYMGKTAAVSCNVQILTSIKINQTLKYSASPVTLTLTGQFTGQPPQLIKTGITWKSSDTKIATVDSKGIVRFTGNSGKVTIYATYLGKTTSVTCTVGNVVKSLSSTTKLAYSKTPVKITIIATYSNGTKKVITSGIVWTSSNPAVAKVSSSGVVTFTGKNGDVTITATYQGRTISFKTTVNLKDNILKFYTSKTWHLYMDYVGLDVGTLKLNADGTYTWKHPYQGTITGKWEFNKNNTIYLYNFGYNQNKKFEMFKSPYNSNEVLLQYAPGETGTSDYYVGK